MNWVRVILKHKHFSGILFGVFAVLIILGDHSSYYNYLSEFAGQDKKEIANQGEEDNEIPVIKVGQDAITSVVQVILVQAVRSITDIVFSEDGKTEPASSSETRPNAYFKALFNLIISPNAP